MSFDTVQAAYTAFRGAPIKALEARAQAITNDLANNPNADVAGYSIELEGIQAALEEKRSEHTPVNVPELAHTAAGTEQREDAAASQEYRSAFYKHLQNRELTGEERNVFERVNKRSAEFNTLSNAAAAIPTQTLDEIIIKARQQGGLLSVARQFSMPSNISIPIATPSGAAQWHTEGATVESEKANVAAVTFAANEILRVISISAAVQSMTIGAFEAYLSDELVQSVMQTIARGCIDGTGEGQSTGVLTGITWGAGNSVTVAEGEALTFADILSAMSLLKRGYQGNAHWIMNQTTLYGDVYALKDQADRPIYLPDLVNEGPGRIMGHNVVLDDFMPDGTIVFGDPRFYGVNMPSGIQLDMSRESSFSRGLIDYRSLTVCDAKPLVAEAFVKISQAEE